MRNKNAQDVKDKENYFKDRKPGSNFDIRKQFRCFEFGYSTHFRSECPKLKNKAGTRIVNNVRNKTDENLLAPFTISGKINGNSIPILKDTGETVNVARQNYISPESMTGEYVWVQYWLNQRMSHLPITEVEMGPYQN